ncbi:alpha/beta hydrolase [Novosphingobium sp. SL115]|uniref:alpha/beta hydrolase n=1 Tax=Novosphingobium sp. SL115 TaxID=2995150 RepID=UPI00227464CE|nr:alpha/beta hydrolase [Novosphingobium sp. SL115]MCY1672684.1 alpha/beta hydrolase [Novosphingobium sp. SL115]
MIRLALAALALTALAIPAHAQAPAATSSAVRELAPIKVWPGTPPLAADWPGIPPAPVTEQTITVPGDPWGEQLWNVTVPTYQPFLPAAGKGNGAAVIVAPGGGFRFHSIEKEGRAVARWLADHGIAAFLLRYRTIARLPGESVEAMRNRINADPRFNDGVKGEPAAADGTQTLKNIRAHAAEYGIDPQRIGVVGFSAGGHVAGMMALEANAQDRPAFSGLIYGMPFVTKLPPLPQANLPYPPGTPKEVWLRPAATPAPGRLPPIFMVIAQDDVVAGLGFRQFYSALYDADYRPEIHLYARGGHGFGMKPQGNTADLWMNQFHAWIASEGMLKPKAGK